MDEDAAILPFLASALGTGRGGVWTAGPCTVRLGSRETGMEIPVKLVIDTLLQEPGGGWGTLYRYVVMPIAPAVGMILQGTATVPDGLVVESHKAGTRLCYTLDITEVQWDLNTHEIEAGCELTDRGDITPDTEHIITLLATDGWR